MNPPKQAAGLHASKKGLDEPALIVQPPPDPRQRGFQPFKFMGLDTMVPGWSVAIGSVVGIILLCGWGWFGLLYPYIEALRDVQNTHWQKHFKEKPVATWSARDPRGWIELAYYSSDGCLLLDRHSIDPGVLPTETWVLDGSRLGKKANTVPKFSGSRPFSLVSDAEAMGRCYSNPRLHPGTFKVNNGQQQGCWLQVTQVWQDGCQGWFARNQCTGAYGPFNWTKCVH